jgi:hypothetical protein
VVLVSKHHNLVICCLCAHVHLSCFHISGGIDCTLYMHAKISGLSDYLAQDERHAIQIAREIVNSLNYKKKYTSHRTHLSI